MRGKMDKSYFLEKQAFAVEAVEAAIERGNTAIAAIQTVNYDLPNLVNSNEVHDQLKSAVERLNSARRDFEKARWASVETNLEFENWLSEAGCADLLIG